MSEEQDNIMPIEDALEIVYAMASKYEETREHATYDEGEQSRRALDIVHDYIVNHIYA